MLLFVITSLGSLSQGHSWVRCGAICRLFTNLYQDGGWDVWLCWCCVRLRCRSSVIMCRFLQQFTVAWPHVVPILQPLLFLMAVFEKKIQRRSLLDDTDVLTCTVESSQNIQGHTVSLFLLVPNLFVMTVLLNVTASITSQHSSLSPMKKLVFLCFFVLGVVQIGIVHCLLLSIWRIWLSDECCPLK